MVEPLLLGALAFVLLVPLGNRVVDELLRHGIGKRIRDDEPTSHQIKSGTATMGGLYFLAGISVITVALAIGGQGQGIPVLIAMLGYGVLGAIDDWQGLKDAEGVGLLARHKFPVQWGMAFVLTLIVFGLTGIHSLRLTRARSFILPFSGQTVNVGLWFIPIVTLVIVATSNAVNLTDGLDGLAGGTSAIAFAAYGLLTGISGQTGLSFFCFAMVGVLLAFLWFNVHPARMFMGDVGSQALGAGLAVVAMLSGHGLLLPLIGVIFVAEALSVILQVSYFKFTRRKYGEGRRIFRMAPLHYHYELGGWSEVQITLRFWFMTVAAAAMGVGLGLG